MCDQGSKWCQRANYLEEKLNIIANNEWYLALNPGMEFSSLLYRRINIVYLSVVFEKEIQEIYAQLP